VTPFWPFWRRRHRRGVARSVQSLLTEGFVAIDLETTGLDPRRDSIIELAAVPFVDGRPERGYVTHVNPGRPIPSESSRIHGITDEMVLHSPTLSEALVRLEAVCADRVLVGHGIGFDLAVLSRERRARGRKARTNPALDTMRLAANLRPEWRRLGFDEIASLLGIGILGRHTAEGDALAAGEILVALIPEIRTLGAQTIGDILWLQDAGRPGR
jgi:DNA polymerase III epsilon subunit family exonuclease